MWQETWLQKNANVERHWPSRTALILLFKCDNLMNIAFTLSAANQHALCVSLYCALFTSMFSPKQSSFSLPLLAQCYACWHHELQIGLIAWNKPQDVSHATHLHVHVRPCACAQFKQNGELLVKTLLDNITSGQKLHRAPLRWQSRLMQGMAVPVNPLLTRYMIPHLAVQCGIQQLYSLPKGWLLPVGESFHLDQVWLEIFSQ